MQLNIKDSLSKVKIYGRYLSEFLLPDQVDILAKSLQKDIEQKLTLTDVVKCNCDESKQLEEEFEIHHLINDTYQVIGKDSNTVWKQGTLEDCNEFVVL